ncbi:MAG: ABC transporter permease [Candidatus Zixiibacteriota bacterium]
MQVKNIKTIFLKELKDTLRDRRSVIFMLLVPLLAMPLLMNGVTKLMISQVKKIEGQKSGLVVQNVGQLPADLQDTLRASERFNLIDESIYGESAMDSLKAGVIDLLMVVPDNFAAAIDLESPTDLEIYYDNADDESSSAQDKLSDLLSRYKNRAIEARLVKRNISTDLLKPFAEVNNSVASPQKLAGQRLGRIIPYFIILMCFLGAMYPAIDLCVGEKERGTLETLLVAPATRGEFVLGKYGVILLTGMVAGLLSMASMTYSLNNMFGDMQTGAAMMPKIEFNLSTIALILMIVVPLAGIFAAILLSVSIFAKSAKEAQGYMSLANMLLIFPAFVSFLPGINLNVTMALIPVINTSLIVRDAIGGQTNWTLVVIAFISTFALASLALFFAKKWFEREEVLFRM